MSEDPRPKLTDPTLPLFTQDVATKLVDTETGLPVDPSDNPNTLVKKADVEPGRRVVRVDLGHLVTADEEFVGDIPPDSVVTTKAGDVIATDLIGGATVLQRGDDK